MKKKRNYRVESFSPNRQWAAASATVGREQNNIHTLIEVDITEPRRLIREHKERTGERLSLTGYIVTCLAHTIAEHPHINAFRKGRKLILLDDVTISVLVERQISGERIPEPFGIQSAQTKTYRQIHEEIRAAQRHGEDPLGGLSGLSWVQYIPGFLMRTFVRLASRNITMMSRYGAIGVTAIGMFSEGALWCIPLSGATLGLAVGSIVERPCIIDGQLEARQHLCLTASFNHDIVDGAPAARFLRRFSELLRSGEIVRHEVNPALEAERPTERWNGRSLAPVGQP